MGEVHNERNEQIRPRSRHPIWSNEFLNLIGRRLNTALPHIIVPALIFLVGIAIFIDNPFRIESWKAASGDDLFKTITIGLWGIVTQILLDIYFFLRKNSEIVSQANSLCRSTTKLLQSISTDTVKIAQERGHVSAYNDPCFKAIGENCLKAITSGFDFREHIALGGEYLAYESYGFFLDFFLEEQKRRGNSDPLEIRAVHSSPLHMWLDRRGRKFLDTQKKFITEGGKIKRIIVGIKPLKSLYKNSSYLMVIRKMVEIGIEVYYIDRTRIATQIGEVHNYLWVTEGNYLFRWQTHSDGIRLRKAIIRVNDDEAQQSIETWDYIMDAYRYADYSSITSIKDLEELLNDRATLPSSTDGEETHQ